MPVSPASNCIFMAMSEGLLLSTPRARLLRSPGFTFLDHHHDDKEAPSSLTCVIGNNRASYPP